MKELKKIGYRKYLLILGLLLAMAAPLQAATAYDVTNVILTPSVTTGQYVTLTEDLLITWELPTSSTAVMGYYLKFTKTSTALSNPDPDVTTYDYEIIYKDILGQRVVTTDKKFSDNTKSIQELNVGDVNYLHIVTQYLNSSNGIAYNDYVLLDTSGNPAAILIDNVPPTGGLTLKPTSGSSTDVNVESMSFTEPIKYYWLSSANTFPGGAGMPYAPTLVQGGLVPLPNGAVTGTDYPIYAWFQDFAGNRTPSPSATAYYSYSAAVAILHNAFSIEVGSSLVFTVDSTTPYDWAITLSADGVASIASGDTTLTKGNATSITVNGIKTGTFTVTAVLTGGVGTLTSDPIKVEQRYVKGDVNNSGTITPADATAAFQLYLTKDWDQLTDFEKYTADFNDSNTLTPADATGIFLLYLNQ